MRPQLEVRRHGLVYKSHIRDREHPNLTFQLSSPTEVTSTIDKSFERLGRAYGGYAFIWNSNIKGKIIKVDINNNRLCGDQFILNGMLFLMLNAYMPCDRYIEDPVTMPFSVNEGIGLILVIQTFYPSTLGVLYNKDVYPTSSIV